jgi:prepilin-type processing-associated H-X9-DG protein
VELLVAIAIIAILFGLVLAAAQRVREASFRTRCQNNLRQIGLAEHQYHDACGTLPPGTSRKLFNQSHPFMNWHAYLLPYLEQDALWRAAEMAYMQTRFFSSNPPHSPFATVMPLFVCPSDPWSAIVQKNHHGAPVALTDYMGNAGTNELALDGVLFLDSQIRFAEIMDGLSNTLLVGERPPSPDFRYGWWYAGLGQMANGSLDSVLGAQEINVGGPYGRLCPYGPYSFQNGSPQDRCSVFHYWSFHPGGANFLLCDGSVHFVAYSAAPVMPALATRAGAEAVSPP